MKKKLISIITAFVISVTLMPVYAANNTGEPVTETVLSEDNMFMKNVSLMSDYENSGAYEAIRKGLLAREKKIDISKYEVPNDELSDFFYRIVYDNPDIFWARTGYNCSYYPTTGYITSLEPDYLSDITEKEIENINNKVDEIIASHITEEMTDAEKALVLHDYIVNTTNYNLVGDESYTAYGVLADNVGVCQGYSMAYGWLLKKCGIDWGYVSSESMEHGWNEVCLDDSWYHVDVTWDDPTDSTGDNTYCRYDYFLRSDEQFKNEFEHYDWFAYYECNGGKYNTDGWSYRKASNSDYIMKYNNGRYCYETGYFASNNFVESDFDGGNSTNKSREYYDSIEYPYDVSNLNPTAKPAKTSEPTPTMISEPTSNPTDKPIRTDNPTPAPTDIFSPEPTIPQVTGKPEQGVLVGEYDGMDINMEKQTDDDNMVIRFYGKDADKLGNTAMYSAEYDDNGKLTDISLYNPNHEINGNEQEYIFTVPLNQFSKRKIMIWTKECKPVVTVINF